MPTGKITQKKDVAQLVTDTIIAAIEGNLNGSWKRPWKTVAGGTGNVHRSNRGRSYRGMNQFLLMIEASAKGYQSLVWGTYKAWQTDGCQVRKGERGTMVTLWKFIKTKDKETGKDKIIPFLRSYTVFNSDQVEGYEEKDIPEPKPVEVRHKDAHDLLARYLDREGIRFSEGGDSAHYMPSRDEITMPVHAAFKDDGAYIATMAHECGHSTGHKKRLNRPLNAGRFGNEAYAFEELVAELSATMLCCEAGVEQPEEIDNNHAHYVKAWLRVLKNDKNAIIKAAGLAAKAVDRILDRTFEAEEADSSEGEKLAA